MDNVTIIGTPGKEKLEENKKPANKVSHQKEWVNPFDFIIDYFGCINEFAKGGVKDTASNVFLYIDDEV